MKCLFRALVFMFCLSTITSGFPEETSQQNNALVVAKKEKEKLSWQWGLLSFLGASIIVGTVLIIANNNSTTTTTTH